MLAVCCVLSGDGIVGVAVFKHPFLEPQTARKELPGPPFGCQIQPKMMTCFMLYLCGLGGPFFLLS